MKATSIRRVVAAAAAGALTLTGLAVVSGVPAGAATRSTVVMVTSNAFSSLNPSTPETNLTTNNDIAYLTGMGFIYYDNNANLKKNTTLGTYKITKNTSSDFRVTYTINKGKLWSDGTAITGADLLLSHVLSSSAYSKKAGLGDPANPEVAPKFNSLGYGGIYDNNVVGLPTLSSDGQSVTVRYKKFLPDWELIGPGVSPVHALVAMANGKKTLQSASANKAAKATFVKTFKAYSSSLLTKIAKVWSEDYNITTVTSSTNPLLLVGNGAYQVKSAVANQSVTLGLNAKYNSGPKTSGIKTIVLKMIADGNAAAAALANKEIDIYQGQPTADAVAQLKAIKSAKVIGGVNSCYEHVDLRVGSVDPDSDYTGVFAKSNNTAKDAKARDLRTAFLLAFPRQEIVDKLIKPINSKAVVVNSVFTLPGQTGYSSIVKSSGVSKFTAGTQASRTAQALALVKKHYPSASASNPQVDVRILWGQPNNARRAAEAALIKAEVEKAGFNLNANGTSGWSGQLASNSYDAAFFAWCPTSTSQTGTNANFLSDGGNNFIGYNSDAMDSILKSLESKLTSSQITAKYLAAEKLLIKDAITLGIFQHPAATAHNASLKNVKPAPLSPNLVWNFWEWKY